MRREELLALAESIEFMGRAIERYGKAIRAVVGDVDVTAEEMRCPNCGSPNYSDLSGMGMAEYQCRDCRHSYAPIDATVSK